MPRQSTQTAAPYGTPLKRRKILRDVRYWINQVLLPEQYRRHFLFEDGRRQCVTGWQYFSNPRMFAGYGRHKGWEREPAKI